MVMDNKQLTKQAQHALLIISGIKVLQHKAIDKITEDDLDNISRGIEKEFETWWVRNDADTFYYQSLLTWLGQKYKKII